MKTVHQALVLALACAAPLAWAQTITVAWREKPPYHYTENGVEKGAMLVQAKALFAAAGIDARFVKEPTKRIWANLQSGVKNYCSIGWYYLPERAEHAQFSLPIHIDRPHQVMVAPAAVSAVSAHASLASLLADPRLRLGLIDGVSYGPPLDALIRTSANQVLRRTVDVYVMMRMTAAGRADFSFVDRDDWEYAQQNDPALRLAVMRDFPDMPPGLQRFIVCSKDVAPATMARLNKAIEAHPPARPR